MAETVPLKSNWRGRALRYAPLVLWVGVIMVLSSGQASMSETSRFIRPFLEFLFPAASPETLLQYHGYIRKSAHVAEYAVLALFAARAFLSSSNRVLSEYWTAAAILLILLVALMDETNQSLSSTRTGSPLDVLLDMTGGIAAIVFIWLMKGRQTMQKSFDE